METKMYITSLCLGLLIVSNGCLGIDLSIDNRTGIPFTITVQKDDKSLKDIKIPTKTLTKIGTLGHRVFNNIERILEIDFVEGWQSWGKRLVTGEDLPEFTNAVAVKLDRALDQLKREAKKTNPKNELVLEIGLDAQRNLTFHGRVVGEWVDVHQ